jgi:outer membrane protein assembly factor BamB
VTIRLWPAAVVLAAGLLWTGRIWLLGEASGQERTIATIVTVGLTLIGLVLWLVLLSRLPARVRWTGGGLVVLAAGLAAGLFRVRGVTGDFVPVVEPRWGRGQAEVSPAAPVAVVSALPAAPAPAPAAPGPVAAAEPAVPAAPEAAYARFQGPNGDATLPGPRLSRDWSRRPPQRLWRRPVGEAWSGFALLGGVAVTQEQHGGEERVAAYDARSGRPLWSHAERARFDTVIAGVGPRATPTLHRGRVYAMGATGVLTALDLATGRLVWRRDVVAENGATLPEWGKAGSPLVVAERVIVSAGGADGRSLVAYEAGSGAPVWSGGHDGSSYSTPALRTLGGRPQVVILNRGSVAGHDPATGALLWEHPFPGSQPNVAVPLLLPDDRLLVSVGYGIGSKLYRVQDGGGAWRAEVVWESPRLKSKFGNLIAHEGSVYGLDDGVLTCLDPATGERRWKGGRYGHGQLLLVGGLLLVQTEEGEVVLVEPSPEAHRELTRFAALEGKTWNPPALAGALLVVRNDREAAAYELPLDQGAAVSLP